MTDVLIEGTATAGVAQAVCRRYSRDDHGRAPTGRDRMNDADDPRFLQLVRERLASPEEDDVPLEDVASELGFDLQAMRADLHASHAEGSLSSEGPA